MGAKFTQVIIKGPTQSELATLLRTKGRRASIGPSENGFTVLSDEACEGFAPDPMHKLCADLSRTFECPCLGVHYFDDDVLSYFLYLNGNRIDEYDSCPDYHDFAFEHIPPRPPTGGDIEKLGRAFGLTAKQMEEARVALHDEIDSGMADAFPGGPENLASLFRSRDLPGISDAVREMMKHFSAKSAAELSVGMDTAFSAEWRLQHLIDAVGIPQYAMHFQVGTDDEFHDLPSGSIIAV